MAAAIALLLSLAFRLLPSVLAQIDDVGLHFKTTKDVADEASFQPLSPNIYSKVIDPTLGTQHLADLPGFTRSVVHKDHALFTPESQVFAPLPGWTNTLAAYLITPAIGAHFSMLIAHLADNATSGPASSGVERLYFVVSGEVTFKSLSLSTTSVLQVDSYAYAPPDRAHELHSKEGAAVVIIERLYSLLDPEIHGVPEFVVGSTQQQPLVPVPGEVFALRKLLPTTAAYDFNIHIMDFQPGEYLNVKEVHYNQHGLLLLEGRGIYRLADHWYPVQAGDAIYMAPFVPQWYAALGTTRSRYFLYKDTNRDPTIVL